MKKLIFILSLLIFSFVSTHQLKAQASRVFINRQFDTIPKMVIKFNPFMFFSRFSHISLAGEFRVTPYSSFQIEAGYVTRIFTESYFYNQENETAYNGYRINPEWRFYSPTKGYLKFYLAPELYLQQVFRNQSMVYQFQTNVPWEFWYQSYEVKHTQALYGFNLIAGFQGAPKGLPLIDAYAGIGARFERNNYGNLPEVSNGEIVSGNKLEDYKSTPFITVGIKLGLVFDKQ